MKSLKSFLAVLSCTAILLPINSSAQGTGISITTGSEEARKAFIIGRQLKENIQIEDAEMQFNRAIELDPQFALAFLYRGHPGDYEMAFSLIDKVSEGERLAIKYLKAYDFYELKVAKEYLAQLLEQYPSSKHVHLWAGLFYENIMHNYQLALEHFHIASRLDDTYAAPHNEMGYRQMRLGNVEKAEDAFLMYIELAPECPNSFDSYANFLMKLKRYDESIKQYTEAYDLNPDKSITIARIGQNYAFRGEYSEARSYYDKFYELSDNIGQKATALSLSAASYLAEGNIKEAEMMMDKYIDLGKKMNRNTVIVLGTANLGFINLEMGDSEKGLKMYLSAASMLDNLKLPEPTKNRYSFSSLGWLARAYAVNGDFRKADHYLSQARKIADKSNNPLFRNDYNLFVGYVEIERGNYNEAINNLLLCNQDNPFNIYILARAYSLAGESESALELVEILNSWEDFGLDYIVARTKSQKLNTED